ncbi:hypothetical protein DH86_00002800, partial [Scytalidium sp. 3C]
NPYLLMMLENEIQNDAVASFYRSGSDLSAALSSTDILEAELIIMDYNPINRQDKTKDVLQSFLTYLPEDGKSALAAIILEHSSDHAALKGLSNHLYATILLPMKATTRTPPITPFAFAEEEKEIIAVSMDKSADRSPQDRLKRLCLARDNFRCLATGIVESKHKSGKKSFEKHGRTVLAHIIPLAMGQWETNEEV